MKINDYKGNFLCYDVIRGNDPQYVVINKINIKPELRYQGCATALMNVLLNIHNDDIIRIFLDLRHDESINYSEVYKFLSKFGFEFYYSFSESKDAYITNDHPKRLCIVIEKEAE